MDRDLINIITRSDMSYKKLIKKVYRDDELNN